MKPRQKNEETLKFSLELLKRIPKVRKITAKELCEQLTAAGFDRDIRTVQRQLESLSEAFDIERDDRSKPYGYSWKKNAEGFNLPRLSEQESVLLTLAETYLSNLLPRNLMRSMTSFFEQAKYNLGPHEPTKSAKEWLKKVKVVSTTQPLLPPKIRQGVFDVVSEGLYDNKWLNLRYENQNGYETDVRVMPLGLAQQAARLYIVVRYDGFDDERNLALHRIKKAELSTITFKRPADFNFNRYVRDGRFGFGDGKKVILSFSISKVAGYHLTESRLSKDQCVTSLDDHYLIKATVIDSDMLDGWLLSFGVDVWDVQKEAV
ncbi:MAG: putative DNA-binding transcriptional regulator YafY [Arenicella sp.]|jgi:predicted DNA-binding transcriptional regulator YafY